MIKKKTHIQGVAEAEVEAEVEEEEEVDPGDMAEMDEGLVARFEAKDVSTVQIKLTGWHIKREHRSLVSKKLEPGHRRWQWIKKLSSMKMDSQKNQEGNFL